MSYRKKCTKFEPSDVQASDSSKEESNVDPSSLNNPPLDSTISISEIELPSETAAASSGTDLPESSGTGAAGDTKNFPSGLIREIDKPETSEVSTSKSKISTSELIKMFQKSSISPEKKVVTSEHQIRETSSSTAATVSESPPKASASSRETAVTLLMLSASSRQAAASHLLSSASSRQALAHLLMEKEPYILATIYILNASESYIHATTSLLMASDSTRWPTSYLLKENEKFRQTISFLLKGSESFRQSTISALTIDTSTREANVSFLIESLEKAAASLPFASSEKAAASPPSASLEKAAASPLKTRTSLRTASRSPREESKFSSSLSGASPRKSLMSALRDTISGKRNMSTDERCLVGSDSDSEPPPVKVPKPKKECYAEIDTVVVRKGKPKQSGNLTDTSSLSSSAACLETLETDKSSETSQTEETSLLKHKSTSKKKPPKK